MSHSHQYRVLSQIDIKITQAGATEALGRNKLIHCYVLMIQTPNDSNQLITVLRINQLSDSIISSVFD